MIPASLSKIATTVRTRFGSRNRGLRAAPSLRKTWWAGFCLMLAGGLLALLHHFFWHFAPTQEKTDFYEEVQLLLDLQRAIKERTGEVATMDSIRDVVFGPKAVGAELRKRAEQIAGEKVAEDAQKQYATIIKGALERWNESSRQTSRDRALFIITFIITGAGLPLALWWFGLPLTERVAAKLALRRQAKADAQRKKRERALEAMRRRAELRQQAASTQRSPQILGGSGAASK